ncbi:MAG: hypothetical protein ACE5NC_02745, partial [Anaerolineae bacterium]
ADWIHAETASRLQLGLAMVRYCRAVATLPHAVIDDLARARGWITEMAKTGRDLLELSDAQLSALAAELSMPIDHDEIRRAARRLVRQDRQSVSLFAALEASLLGSTGIADRRQ